RLGGDLIGTDRKKISKDCLTLRVARYRAHRTQWTGKLEYEVVPELLERFRPLPLAETRMFWLTLHIPADAHPGLYEAGVALKTSAPSEVNVPFRVWVLPMTLPQTLSRTFGMYYLSPLCALDSSEAAMNLYKQRGLLERMRELRARDFRDMRDHGVNMIQPAIWTRVCEKAGQISFDIPAEYVDAAQQAGLLQKPFIGLTPNLDDICAITGTPRLAPKGGADVPPPFSESFNRIYLDAIRFVQRLAKEKGWPEVLFYVVDEPSDAQRKEVGKRLCRLVHQAPGARTFVTGCAAESYLDAEFLKLIDVVCYTDAGSVPDESNLRENRWFYPNSVTASSGNASFARFATGLGFWFSGLHGCVPWRYLAGEDSLETDLDGNMTDFFLAYPMAEEHVPTIRWECWREGVDDCRYLTLLEEKIQLARASRNPSAMKAAVHAKETLDHLRTFVPTLRQFAAGIVPAAIAGNAGAGTFDRESWVRAHCARIRWVVACHALQIEQALSGAPAMPVPPAASNAVEIDVASYPDLPDHRCDGTGRSRSFLEKSLGAAAAQKMVMDGNLNEDCWRTAARVQLVNREDGSVPREKTEVMAANDAANVYFAFRCYDSDMTKITAKITRRDESVWDDDCVEVFLGSEIGCRDFYHFIVNANGALTDAFYPSGELRVKWNSNAVAAARKFDAYWQAELQIPLSDIGLVGSRAFGLNLCREEKTFRENTCWSTSGAGFDAPRDFGRFVLSGSAACFSRIELPRPSFGPNDLRIEIANRAAQDASVVAVMKLACANTPLPREWKTDALRVKAGATIQARLPFEISGAGDFDATVTLLSCENSECLDSRELKIRAAEILTATPNAYFVTRGLDRLSVVCDLSVSDALLRRCALRAEILRSGEDTPLAVKQTKAGEISGARCHIGVNTANLAPGKHRLGLTLETGAQEAVFTRTLEFRVVESPADLIR
ncbi:MAG: DUF4091 domain-containing protein, partial [Verrucomicrobia bacterium]|nr:DUF4091 domain-containing protein [Verrucomicrobiota bacterium]